MTYEETVTNNDASDNDGLVADESLVEVLRERLEEAVRSDDDHAELDASELQRLCEDRHALRRFLVARLNNVEKAYKMAYEALKWRSRVHPHKLQVQDFATANAQQVYRFAGYAKNGWPIILVKACHWDPAQYSTDEYMKMVAFFLETNERRMDPNAPDSSRNYMIFDVRGMSYLKSDMTKIRQLAKLTADYYPERLGYGVILNADVVFWAIWKLASPLLDQRTRDKARFFRNDYHDFLEQHVGLENIAQDLGGTRAEEWPPLTEENQHTFQWTGRDNVVSVTKRQETTESEASFLSSIIIAAEE